MLLATGGGSKARAFGGMGRGVAEDSEKEGRARGGGKVAAGTASGGKLALGTAPGVGEREGKGGGNGVRRGPAPLAEARAVDRSVPLAEACSR